MVPGVSDLVPSVLGLVPGVSDLVLCVSEVVPCVSDLVPGVSVMVPGVSDLVPGVLQTAEQLFVKGGCIKDAIDMHTAAGSWEKAHKVSAEVRVPGCGRV